MHCYFAISIGEWLVKEIEWNYTKYSINPKRSETEGKGTKAYGTNKKRKYQNSRPKLKHINSIYIIKLSINCPNTPINGRGCQIGVKRKSKTQLYAIDWKPTLSINTKIY